MSQIDLTSQRGLCHEQCAGLNVPLRFSFAVPSCIIECGFDTLEEFFSDEVTAMVLFQRIASRLADHIWGFDTSDLHLAVRFGDREFILSMKESHRLQILGLKQVVEQICDNLVAASDSWMRFGLLVEMSVNISYWRTVPPPLVANRGQSSNVLAQGSPHLTSASHNESHRALAASERLKRYCQDVELPPSKRPRGDGKNL